MEVEYVEGYQPGFLGRIAEMHGVYYAGAWGSGFEFEGIVAHDIREFLSHFNPERDFLLTAHVGGRLVGSIAVQGTQTERPGGRIRWVVVESEFHGRGIGKDLLAKALAFCRKVGFASAFLWTVEGLPQSFALYERAGFRVIERVADDRHSLPHVNLLMEANLA